MGNRGSILVRHKDSFLHHNMFTVLPTRWVPKIKRAGREA